MRVNIAYSVDMDEIPKEVCGLLPRESADPQCWIAQIIDDLEARNVDSAISGIDNLRKHMFEVDQRLADCSAILHGYLGNKYNSSADVATAQDVLDGIEKQLEGMVPEVEDDSAS